MYKSFFLILSFLGAVQSFAENSYRFDIYGSSTNRDWNDLSPYNANNSVLEVPQWTHTVELRPDIQLNFNDKHSMVLRSRHFLQSFETLYLNPKRTRFSSDDESDLSDLFFSSTWADTLATTIGLQNYQWGPAEIFSPSNPFFHFGNNQRSFFFKEKGKILARVNWNPDPDSTSWSVIAMYEPENNKTAFWTADKEFTPKSSFKIEYQFENPANAVSIMGGFGEGKESYYGEYFTWSPNEGISFYGDAQHRAGRYAYTPQANGVGGYDLLDSTSTKVYTLAVVGFRWEGRVDFRQEFIFNEAGYSKEEWTRARAAGFTLSPNILQNARRFAAPGLEFRTKAYSYTSVRIPDLGLSRMASIGARWLTSMMHDSGALQMNYEYNWDDNTVLSVEAIHFTGSPSGEFRIVDNKQASLGFRWSY